MSISRPVKNLTALVLAGAALAVAADAGVRGIAEPGAARAGTSSASDGNPSPIPPILRSATPAELAIIRSGEAGERAARRYHPPAGAPYDSAVFDVFTQPGGGGS